jgi:hypothetical protein
MKPLIFFFIFGLSAYTCYTQDTLVDSKGLIFPARITAVDSNFITYASPDTLIKEQIIIPRSTIIFIKHENGKTEQLYVSDTLITKEGLFITCKVLEIDASTLTYFTFRDKFTSPSVMMKSNLLLIKLHDGTNEIGDQLSGMSDTDYQNLGITDAKMYYKTKPEVIVGSVIMGATSIFVAPILIATIIAWTPPKNLHCSANPNDSLLGSNTQYYKGFRNGAKRKKASVATASYFSGLGAFVVFIGAMVSFYW